MSGKRIRGSVPGIETILLKKSERNQHCEERKPDKAELKA